MIHLSQVKKIVVTHNFTTDITKSHDGGDYSYGIMYTPDCDSLNIAQWGKTHWCDSDFYCCPICGHLGIGYGCCSCDEDNIEQLSTQRLAEELTIAFEKYSVKIYYTACKIVKSLQDWELD